MANLVGLKTFETRSSKDYRRAMVEIERHLEDVLGDDVLLAYIVASGGVTYRNVFLTEFRSFTGIDRGMPDLLWGLFTQTWGQRYPRIRPGQYLDRIHITTPPTAKEIDDAWVIESASSDEARRYFGVA